MFLLLLSASFHFNFHSHYRLIIYFLMQVTHLGCVGGRKTQHEETQHSHQKDFMLFRDTTVSRKHFEVSRLIFI